jgi:hypothetical protein
MSNPQVRIFGQLGSSGLFPTLGSTTVTLADANHTLTVPSETCYQSLIVDGTQTAVRNIVAPLVAGFTFLVLNSTSGGFAINFGGSSGDTVAVPPNEPTWVTTDGTNYFEGGSPSASPLSRTPVVDAGTTAAAPNGSFDAPLATIGAALATFGQPTSANDADAASTVLITSATNGYTENPAIPAYRNTVLQAITLNEDQSSGPNLTGNITWTNTAGAGGIHPPGFATLSLVNFAQSGNITVTDDATVFSGIAMLLGASCTEIIGTGATDLSYIFLAQSSVVTGNVNCPHSSIILTGSSVIEGGAVCSSLDIQDLATVFGNVTCSGTITIADSGEIGSSTVTAASITITDSTLASVAATLASGLTATRSTFQAGSIHCGATAEFSLCTFSGGFQVTATNVLTDAVSWQNYLAQGGLPNGSAVTITNASATAYGNSFSAPTSVEPATGAGTPIAAFNLTPTQSGLIELDGVIAVSAFSGADAPVFNVFLYEGTSTGVLSPAVNKGGIMAGPSNPITIPVSSPTLLGTFTWPAALATMGALSMTLATFGLATVGTAASIVITATSLTGTSNWSYALNLTALERPLN